ncbi:unnamed protein product [Rotaria magnacalcarata]|uniref:G-protein coupled receptors family 1 profile domain-containing protein n=2 Tax=Rotaria magnacalcarata TaxID=392030 RepID=A0A814YZK1_9BILA|nr:unnamed protein product [Rotaria magnacalcarata]CAF2055857.1 unnamed protein product [Rotaria magnacalcarata]CAF3942095.1 unnamed protein product [Rotaria magnacalcarata]CAF3965586.1 unnamed protein product [Rotaria magnacalcarata]CAF4328195.1 unnamed protein product [Rotaria magnacalcarata]
MMEYADSAISNSVRFWLCLTAVIPSIGCSIAILYHILSNRTRRNALNNHVVVILLVNNLIYELIDISLFLNYYRLGVVWPASESLCLIWIYVDEALYTVSTVTVAWASIERHMLIFHDRWYSTPKRRFLVHYLPFAILVSYIFLFHFFVIITPPCKNTYDYTEEICGHPLCFHNNRVVGSWDTIAHDIIPTITIVICSISLLVRVVIKNRHIRKRFQWRKHRKMAIQLLSISYLYCVLYIPVVFIELTQLCCKSNLFSAHFQEYTRFFAYYVIFLLPFVYLVALMESSWRIKNIFPCWCRTTQTVYPTILHTTHIAAHQPTPLESTPQN